MAPYLQFGNSTLIAETVLEVVPAETSIVFDVAKPGMKHTCKEKLNPASWAQPCLSPAVSLVTRIPTSSARLLCSLTPSLSRLKSAAIPCRDQRPGNGFYAIATDCLEYVGPAPHEPMLLLILVCLSKFPHAYSTCNRSTGSL